jgi:hypothetical protein
MYLYYYYFIALFLVVLHAFIDADEIKRYKTINHKVEFFFFSFTICLSIILFYQSWYSLTFVEWGLYCGVTTLFLRVGFYDFSLNLFRGKNIGYISQNADGNYQGTKESLYDDLLHKFGINANFVRISGIVISIIWLLLIKKLM